MTSSSRDTIEDKETSLKMLGETLGDTYVLYAKTQGFHWNVNDPRFFSLHTMFEGQYQELANALDELAERMKMVGGNAPGSLKQFLELAQLQESQRPPAGNEMVHQLQKDHEAIIERLKGNISTAQTVGDEGTADLLIQRLRAHEKMAWMLRNTK